MSTLIVFSHLRWDFVFQRPQHVLARMAAAGDRVLFVEEPVHDPSGTFFETLRPMPNVEVLRPHTPVRAGGFHDDQLPVLRTLLAERLGNERECVAWFYTPMALPLLADLQPTAVVYDCMDELASFRFAPRQLLQRESALLRLADVVFTGGPSLYEAKRERNHNVHNLPSSVDAAHFAPHAAELGHPEQYHIAEPRLGYFGVIDERVDLQLIATLADERPDWQIVMVGPFAKIDEAAVPRRPNIHWLGKREYAELPRFVARWDVCLLPFATNEATRYISPTKTLEYMAAERPIVSTPVRDVEATYSDVVRIARSPSQFVAACAAAMRESEAERAMRIARMREIVASTSWDRTAARMRELIREAPARVRDDSAARAMLPKAAPHFEQVIIGAGPTGLAAAHKLGRTSLLLERQRTVGGWCRSIADRGYTFDYAGHIMFSKDPEVLSLYEKLLGDNVHWQDREAWIWSKGVYTRYPFQGALYGLPPDVLKECIVGAIEARFGPLKPDAKRGDASKVVEARSAKPEPANFEEFIHRVWGAGVAKHFAIPYNRKLWAVPLAEMETSWLGGRVPLPDLEEMIEGALSPVPKPMGPNARFGYPLRGGFQALMDGFLPHLEGRLELDADVVGVSPSRRTVTLADGRVFRYDTLISTLPLPRLVQALGDEAPEAIRRSASALRHVSVRCVNLGVARPNLTEKHWIYYPEDSVFHRIFVQGNASPHCNAPGGFGLTCEITYSPQKPLPCDGDALIQRCIEDCVKVGIFGPEDRVEVANQVDMPYAYVVYDHARAANVDRIRQWLEPQGILLAGRYSEWEYYNSDHAFIAGRKAAERALEHASARTRAVTA